MKALYKGVQTDHTGHSQVLGTRIRTAVVWKARQLRMAGPSSTFLVRSRTEKLRHLNVGCGAQVSAWAPVADEESYLPGLP